MYSKSPCRIKKGDRKKKITKHCIIRLKKGCLMQIYPCIRTQSIYTYCTYTVYKLQLGNTLNPP